MYIDLQKDDGVALLTINRPEALNAMNAAMLDELCAVFEQVESDDDVRVLIITGTGRAFIAGADIAHMQGLSPQQAKAWSEMGQRLSACSRA